MEISCENWKAKYILDSTKLIKKYWKLTKINQKINKLKVWRKNFFFENVNKKIEKKNNKKVSNIFSTKQKINKK